MDTSLRMLVRRMAYAKFGLTYLIIGILAGVLIIAALIYRLCCYKNRVPSEQNTNTSNLHVRQVDVVRIPPTGVSTQ